MARNTIARPCRVAGTGLHTGAPATVTCHPAAPGQGIRFRRVDLPGAPELPAQLDHVIETERRTTLGQGDAAVHTVEHLLAAVAALELDDLRIEVDGPEPPALDGSFLPYLTMLRDAGVTAQEGEPVIYRVQAPFQVTEGDATYVVSPAKQLRLTTIIEWGHPCIGRQVGSFDLTPERFASEIAPARTFGLLGEVEALRAKGLALGASEANVVVLGEEGVLNGPLRWPDEFVRHKAGDIVGDLALAGGRVQAHIVATRPSHRGNVALARALTRTAQRQGGVAMDIGRILDVIPHRYPFLLVDRIIEMDGTRRIVGIKNVTINEPFFQGHFPGHPIMPGVLIIEAMAQVGGMLLLNAIKDAHTKVAYFMSLDNVKFRRPVVPGDQLRCEVEILQLRGTTFRMRGVAYVDGNVVTEAEMMAKVVDK
ncbi:MAG TPA: bifunctional UDP-3-O-[3-hydroxymyristoyl] N-acetylglucosamine deacetylase/3-hydroxyacyl-ACP dehydratase [Gemmatimonadales bacterium]|nr:bifunctional UDP-3-O-[3-hydroxymyristoyl] N-acetylglucosamine deacetylase/3-hydroxyacyl-ACP dehydratase [Gemmatimonadales bacterium]